MTVYKIEFIETGKRFKCSSYQDAKKKAEGQSKLGKPCKVIAVSKDTRFQK